MGLNGVNGLGKAWSRGFGLVGCEEVEIQVARTDCRQILFGQRPAPSISLCQTFLFLPYFVLDVPKPLKPK